MAGTERQVSFLAVLRDGFSPTFQALGKKLQGTLGQFQDFEARVSPLVAKIGAVLGGLSVAGIGHAALQEAEQAERSQAKLLVALRGREAATKKITAAAQDLQEATGIDNDLLVEQAAILAELGVAAADIPRALQVAADVASALNLDIGSAVREVGLLLTGAPSRLATKVEELRDLQKEGKLATGALAALEERFGGAAAAAAAGKFGQVAKDLQGMSDALRPLGDRLGELEKGFVSAARGLVEKVGAFFDSDGVKQFTKTLAGAAPAILTIVAGLGALLTALAVIKAGSWFVGFVASATILAAKVAIVGGLLGGLAYAVLKLTGLWEPLIKAAGDFGDEIADISGKVAEGKLGVQDLVDVVVTQLQRVKTNFLAYVWTPIREFFVATGRAASALFTLAISGLKSVGLEAVRLATVGLNDTVNTALDRQTEKFRQAASDLANAYSDAFDRIATAQATADDDIAKSGVDLTNRLRASENAHQAASLKDADERIAKLHTEADEALKDLARVQRQSSANATLSAALASPEAILGNLKHAREVLGQLDAEAVDPVRDAIFKDLDARLKQEAISAREFVEARRQLELGVAQDRLTATEQAVADQKSAIDGLEQQRLASADAVTAAEEGLSAVYKKQFFGLDEVLAEKVKIGDAVAGEQESTLALLEATQTLARLEEQRRAAAVDVANAENSVEQARVEAASGALQRVGLAQDRLQALGEELKKALDFGTISGIDALRTLDVQADQFAGAVEHARAIVLDLLQGSNLGDELRGDLEKAKLALDELTKEPAKLRVEIAGDVLGQLEKARDDLSTSLQVIQSQVDVGQLTVSGAAVQSADAFDQFRKSVEATTVALVDLGKIDPELAGKMFDALHKIEAGAPKEQTDAGFSAGLDQGFTKTAQNLASLQNLGDKVGTALASDLSAGLVDVFVDGQQSFEEFLRAFLKGIAKMILQAIILRATLSAIGLPVIPGFANSGGKATSSGILTFDAGGSVPGPGVHRDIVPAMLTPGEWVVREAAAQFYGDEVMAALNRRLIPAGLLRAYATHAPSHLAGVSRFAEGGAVVSGAPAPDTTRPIRAYVVGSEQEAERMLAGGRPAYIRFFSQNADEIRVALGIT